MDTAKYGNGRNPKSQFNVIPLLEIVFSFVILFSLTSCFESSSEDTPQPVDSSPTDSNTQTSEGQALYAANCAGCHGPDGSTINGNTPVAITAAITSIGTMNGISLTASQVQAVSDFLTGNTSGGSGGNTGGGGGTSDGQALYAANCASCHGADGSALTDRTAAQIAAAIVNVSTMTGVSLSGTEIQAIADFLSVTSDGQALYAANCSGCHGADGSTLAGRTGAQIAAAIVNVSTMMGVSLSGTEIIAIADFLSGSSGGGSTGGPPANHTNSEDGVLHAPGNTLPYSSGCTVCHGASLEGGVGPSCFACHAETWSESAPTGGGTGSGGSTDGQALYTTYCAACHGVTGTSLSGRTTDQISTAISSVATMNSIALSLTELQAIADYLSANTGGGTGGDTGGGTGSGGSGTVDGQALYTANCSVCHGADAATINDKTASGITAAMT
ncbi:MAG: c-type cytochrome, partial [Gammaproteobacteria bacterium]|nr:c-type cytochrome [Gammaproteobacteria bacterium]